MPDRKANLAKRLDWVPARLVELLETYHVPGGSVAVWYDGAEYLTAAGKANVVADIDATPKTLFLIGSITKVYTATLVMQLVDDGAIDLDAPVAHYLPELRVADEDARATITVRQLLSHTSGITGDYLPDCGRGDDAVERFVGTLVDAGMLYRPGEMFSYCNSGFVLAGRLVERLTDGTWDAALRSRLLEPIDSTDLATLPEEALSRRVAVGHLRESGGTGWRVGQMWPELRSGGPAGFTPFATGADVLRFARLHLDGGVTPEGKRVLSSASVAAMQAQEVIDSLSGPVESDGWGLGWARFRHGRDEPVIGHNGGSSATLRVLPDRDFAVTVLTNAGKGDLVGHRLVDDLVRELFELSIPVAGEPPSGFGDLAPYEGTYRHGSRQRRVVAKDDVLAAYDEEGTQISTLRPLDPTLFLSYDAGSDVTGRVSFIDAGEGRRPRYVHGAHRAFRRQD